MRVTVILLTGILVDSVQSGTSSSVAVLNVYGDSGTFLSPGYPKQYSNNLNLTYTAHLDSSGPLMVRLSMELDLQGKTGFCYDYVRVFSLLYCGAGSLVTEVQVSGDVLQMLFISDSLYTYRGFNITYTVLPATTTAADESTSVATDELVTFSTDSTTASWDSSSMATDLNIAPTTDTSTLSGFPNASSLTASTSGSKLLSPASMETSHSEESSTLTSEVTRIEITSDRNLGTQEVILTPVTDPTGVQSSDVSAAMSLTSRVTSTALMTSQAVNVTSVMSPSTSPFSGAKVSKPPGTESLTSAVTPSDSGLSKNVTSGSSPAPTPVLVACRCKSCDRLTPEVAVQQAEARALLLARALAVDRRNVSSLKRRKTSAPDGRVSAVTCGVMITAICVVPFLLLVVADIAAMCTQAKAQRNKRGITA
ncbi:uncharacterized protein LOC112573902 [Pomacea canaliculata]|uniref:uncharacterized protein LOC112573902 n=1 Tax=Pomacea canaliculata TaxID=400727 RepID=UPI000D738139|nr:uncharacterized protein LOC112573902 [Pomacea canaliculata]